MITGLDVSHHQGRIRWDLVKTTGHKFAFIKATEGKTFIDPRFNDNLVGAQEVGMIAGAYHFLRSDSDAEVQANHFLDTIGRTEGILCALDVESTGNSFPLASTVYKFAHVFRHRTKSHPLIIYTGRWYWHGVIGNPEGARLGPLWHSAYKQDPGPLYGGWDKFTFWQYTSTGRSPGIAGNVDLNLFYNGLNALQALTVRDPTTIPQPKPSEEIPEMLVVQNTDTGAALLVSGSRTFLIQDNAHLKDLVSSGIPHVGCKTSQFKRYEGVRADDNKPDSL